MSRCDEHAVPDIYLARYAYMFDFAYIVNKVEESRQIVIQKAGNITFIKSEQLLQNSSFSVAQVSNLSIS